MNARLLHYSDEAISAVEDRDQRAAPAHYRGGRKPWGLWLSVEGERDWRSWCEAESFRDTAKQICHVITLVPTTNVLRLVGALDLLAFNCEFGYDPYEGRGLSFAGSGIRWERVAEQYDGIIIAPYVWSMRLDDEVGWYYGWDCASGCIWNARAVARLTVLQPQDREVAV